MATAINPDTYWIFLEVLAKAPRATTYKCEMPSIFEGESDHNQFCVAIVELPGDQFDQLPWDGEVDDIINATWLVPVEYSLHSGIGVREGRVSVSITHDGGIYVTNPYGGHSTHAVGRTGVMPGNRSDLNLRNRRTLQRHTVDSDEAMVDKVLELLTAGGWQDAERVIAECGDY